MAIKKFEDIVVWQKAQDFSVEIYNDFSRFLYFSLASNSEVRSMLYLAIKPNFISKERSEKLVEMSNEIARMLFGLIKSLKTKTKTKTNPNPNPNPNY